MISIVIVLVLNFFKEYTCRQCRGQTRQCLPVENELSRQKILSVYHLCLSIVEELTQSPWLIRYLLHNTFCFHPLTSVLPQQGRGMCKQIFPGEQKKTKPLSQLQQRKEYFCYFDWLALDLGRIEFTEIYYCAVLGLINNSKPF